MLYLAAIVITKCVVVFSQQPSARDSVVGGTKPWINSQARRVWRTRWRGSLGWDHRVHQINRAKPNRLSSSSQMTSSRWAEHNKPLYMFHAPSDFLPHVLHHNRPVLFCFLAQELHPDCGLNNRVRMMNHVCSLAKTKKFEEVSPECDINTAAYLSNLAPQMESFQNPLDLFHLSIWWRDHRKWWEVIG